MNGDGWPWRRMAVGHGAGRQTVSMMPSINQTDAITCAQFASESRARTGLLAASFPHRRTSNIETVIAKQ